MKKIVTVTNLKKKKKWNELVLLTNIFLNRGNDRWKSYLLSARVHNLNLENISNFQKYQSVLPSEIKGVFK